MYGERRIARPPTSASLQRNINARSNRNTHAGVTRRRGSCNCMHGTSCEVASDQVTRKRSRASCEKTKQVGHHARPRRASATAPLRTCDRGTRVKAANGTVTYADTSCRYAYAVPLLLGARNCKWRRRCGNIHASPWPTPRLTALWLRRGSFCCNGVVAVRDFLCAFRPLAVPGLQSSCRFLRLTLWLPTLRQP